MTGIENRRPRKIYDLFFFACVLVFHLIFTSVAEGQIVLARWDFEDSDIIVDEYNPENPGITIERENTPGISITYPGSGNPGNCLTGDSWDNGSDDKYWQIALSTYYTSGLKVGFDQSSGFDGPRDFRMQYKIGNSGTWLPLTGNDITLNNGSWIHNSFSLPATCDNQSLVFIRWIMTSNASVTGGPVSPASTSSIDNINITGTHNFSCFSYGYMRFYTCGATFQFPGVPRDTLGSIPPGYPGSPNYGSCWQNKNSGNRANWVVFQPTAAGNWSFVFFPDIGNVNAWIWGPYDVLPTDCESLQELRACNNGTGGNPVTVSTTVETGKFYVTLVTNPTSANSTITMTVNEGEANLLPPLTIGAENCGPASLTLTASGAIEYEVYEWWDAPTGGNLLKRTADRFDSIFTTPFLTTTAIYYVNKVFYTAPPFIDTCWSPRVPVAATIHPLVYPPDSITTNLTNVCSPDSRNVILTAWGGAGTILNWYQDSCHSSVIATGNPFTIPAPSATTTYYAAWESLCGLSDCAQITITVNAPVTAGVIAADQTLCAGGDPSQIISLVNGTGSGIISYRWESFTGIMPWIAVAAAGGPSYDPPVLTQTTTYQRITVSTEAGGICESLPTTPVTVYINDVYPGAVTGDQELCYGAAPASFMESLPASGSGILTYQWEQGLSLSGPWTAVPGGINVTFTPSQQPAGTYYFRRTVTSSLNGTPCTASSNVLTMVVFPLPATSPITRLVSPLPPASAFIDTVCIQATGRGYHVTGLAGSTFNWTVTGGTAVPVTSDDTIYINWGSVPGTYPVIVQETSINGCPGPVMTGSVFVSGLPYAYAGPGTAICAGTNLTLSASDTAWCSSICWTTAGDGSFSNPNSLHPVYTPGPGDITAQSVVLTLTATGIGALCPPASSSLTLRISNIMATVQATNATCYGYDDGSAIVNVTGAIPPLSILWSNGQTGNTATGLAPGSYSVLVTDSVQCQWSGTFVITQTYATLSAQISRIGPAEICEGDSTIIRIDLTGTAPWNITYTDGTTTTTLTGVTSSPVLLTIFPLQSCVYTLVAVTDAFCTAMPGMLTGSAPVTVFPLPGVEFTWQNGNQNFEIMFFIDSTITNLNAIGNMLLWNFGDGTFGYETNPVHLYPSYNDFIVTLTVIDTIGCPNSVTHTVPVRPVPIAFFSSNSPQCFGQDICFTDLSTASPDPFSYITTWIWNYADGTPNDTIHFPYNPNVCHHYDNFSIYPVTLTVIDNNGNYDSFTRNVNLIPVPIADFSNTDACLNQIVQFTDQSSVNGSVEIISWEWNFGDPLSGTGNTSSNQNPQHNFSIASGYHTVTLVITNANFCKDTIARTIYVRPSPTVAFSTSPACLEIPVTFTADTSLMDLDSIVTWSWDFGDGSVPSDDPLSVAHTYTSTGVYVATLTVMDVNGCYGSLSDSIHVGYVPVALFSWSNPICGNIAVQFTSESTVAGCYITEWRWDFGDGTDTVIYHPSSPNIQHVFTPGSSTHLVTLTVVSSLGCEAGVSNIIESITPPVAAFTNSQITCQSQIIVFQDQSSNQGGSLINSWHWNFGDPLSGTANVSLQQNPSHTFNQPGTYQVTLIVSNLTGCYDTIVKYLDVHSSPLSAFTVDTVCLGNPNTFTDLSIANGGIIINWLWDFGDGTFITGPLASHIFSNAGSNPVILTVKNSYGCINSATNPAEVYPLPVAQFFYTTQNCAGTVVQFTDASHIIGGYQGSITQWTWDFGDGSPIQTINYPGTPDVSHVFPLTGTYFYVTLTVTTSDNCSNSMTKTVQLNPAPTANFSHPPFNCSQSQIPFTDVSTGNGILITQWNWNFSDPLSGSANNSNLQNPVHSFSGPGYYDVRLIVTNINGCSDTIIKNVSVVSQPTADFSANMVCLGNSTLFSNLSTGNGPGTITQSFWDFGDGYTSGAPNPSHTYSLPGNYQVTLVVATGAGCTSDTMKVVQVLAPPVAQFNYPALSCSDDTLMFSDASLGNGSGITGRTWDFGDGTLNTSNAPVVTHHYSQAGNYLVTLTITTANGCTSQVSHQVQVNQVPSVNFIWPTTHCYGSPLQFYGTGTQVTQWLWDFGDPASGSANTSAQQNPIHLFTGYGNYTVTLQVTSQNGCTNTKVRTVTIDEKPVAQFVVNQTCAGFATEFTDSSLPHATNIVSWLWNFGDPASGNQNTSTLQDPVHVFSLHGSYLVHLTVVNSNNCQNDTMIAVNVVQRPDAMFQHSSSCFGSPTVFTDLSTAPGSQLMSWSWDFGDGYGTSNLQNPSYTYSEPGTYQVKLTVENAEGCTDIITVPVLSRELPVADFSYNSLYCPAGKVSFQDVSFGIGSEITDRLWIFENGLTSTLPNPVHVFQLTDTVYPVTLIVTDNFGCIDTTVQDVFVNKEFEFSMHYDTVCHDAVTSFSVVNNTSGDSLYFINWDFGDPASGGNNTSSSPNPVHRFTTAGNHIVKLTVTNSNNCTESIYKIVPVNYIPEAEFSYVTPDCQTTVLFSDHSLAGQGNIIQWVWDFGDGSSPYVCVSAQSEPIIHSYSQPGIYEVTLDVTNSKGCTSTIRKNVMRKGCLVAEFDEKNSLFCANLPVSFDDISTPVEQIRNWRWTFGDGSDTLYSVYTPTLSHRYTEEGSYVVTLYINTGTDDEFFRDSARQVVNIKWSPEVAFTVSSSCLNQETQFRDMTLLPAGEEISRHWSFGEPLSGAGNHSTQPDPVHSYDKAGIYPVKLFEVNNFGCYDSLLMNVRISPPPVASFEAGDACSGHDVQFTDLTQITDTAIGYWHWNFGVPGTHKDTSLNQDPQYRFSDGGEYNVRLIVSDLNGCKDTADQVVEIKPSPISAFVLEDHISGTPGTIQLTNQSVNAGSFLWSFGNGESSFEENPVVTYKDDGEYLISLITTNPNGCSDTVFLKYEMLFRGLFVPNAFAPTCDVYGVRTFKPSGMNLQKYLIEVFDEWGHRVWYSTAVDNEGRPVEGWDGRDPQGRLCQQGTYMWKISAVFTDGSEWDGSDNGKLKTGRAGTVALIR